MAKKTDKFYSLINITNGNILSSYVHGVSYWGKKDGELVKRQRNWKLSQFDIISHDILDYFINNNQIKKQSFYWTMGVHEIWVKEEELDMLYVVLANAVLNNFCTYDKQKALFGAFLFHKNPTLFLSEDFTSTRASTTALMKKLKCGKEFLLWLETFDVLCFSRNKYKQDAEKCFFSFNELEVVSKERKDIITTFETFIKR